MHLLLEQAQPQPLFGRRPHRLGAAPAEEGRNSRPQRRPLAGEEKPQGPIRLEFGVEIGMHPRHREPRGAQRREHSIASEGVAFDKQHRLLDSFEQRSALLARRPRPSSAGLGRREGAGDVDRAVFGEREHLAVPERSGAAVGEAHRLQLGPVERLADIEDADQRRRGTGPFVPRLHAVLVRVVMPTRSFSGTNVMDLLPTLNLLVARWETIGGVCVVLTLWAVGSGIMLYRSGRAVRRALESAATRLRGRPGEALAPNHFEALRRNLAEDRVVGPSWRVFAEAVVVPSESHQRPVRATIAPDRLFDLGLYRRVGTDLRYHTALPGLLVGAGLLFTFFGLAVALTNAGAIVTAADPEARSVGLKGLLDAASIKFVTSLVGLFCSIGYALFRKAETKATERALDRFCGLLDEHFPLATPAFFQGEANRTLEAQRKSLDTLANDLAQSIGPALDRTLDARLGEHLGPLREAIEKLAAREAEDVGRTLEAMLERFLEKLQATSGEQLAAVAARLEEASKGLESLRGSLDAAGTKLAEAADSLSRNLQEGSRAAAEKLARSNQYLAQQLAATVHRTNQESNAGLQKLLAAVPEVLALVKRATEAGAASVAEGAAKGAAQFEAAAQKAASALAAAVDRLGDRLDAAAGRLAGAAEVTRAGAEQLAQASGELAGRLGTLGQTMRESADGLRASAQEAGERLEQSAARAGEQLQAVAQPFGAAAQSLAASSAALQKTNERIEAVTKALQETLSRSASLVQELLTGVDQMKQASEQLRTVGGHLTGLDQSLGEALLKLAEQYEAFAHRIVGVVSQVDNNLGTAVTSLQAAIRDLAEAVEDLQPARPGPVRQ